MTARAPFRRVAAAAGAFSLCAALLGALSFAGRAEAEPVAKPAPKLAMRNPGPPAAAATAVKPRRVEKPKPHDFLPVVSYGGY